MPVAAKCPKSVHAPLDETSFLAQAPQCTRCGILVTEVGGTLGMTSSYGVSDPNLTRDRVESDLKRLQEAESRYRGMIYANQQQLGRGAEQYAKLPPSPELLQPLQANETPLHSWDPSWPAHLGVVAFGSSSSTSRLQCSRPSSCIPRPHLTILRFIG